MEIKKCPRCRKCINCRKCNSYQECPICLEPINSNYVINNNILDKKNRNYIIQLSKCKHIFHYKCITTWFEKESTCPLCRLKIIDAYNVKIQLDGRFFCRSKKCVVHLLEYKISFYQIKKHKKKYEYNLLEHPEQKIINSNSFINLKENQYITQEFYYILYQFINLIKIYQNSIVIRYIKGPDLKNYYYSFYNNNPIELKIIFNNLKKRIEYYKMIN